MADTEINFSPGCCCDAVIDCVVLNDTFDRSDEDLGTSSNWVEQNGDWEIVSNVLELNVPADGNHATVDLDHTPVEVGNTGYSIVVKVKVTVSGDKLGALVAWTDTNNYIFALLIPNTTAANATCELWERSGGVNSLLKSVTVTAGVNTFHDLKLCRLANSLASTLNRTGVFVNDVLVILYTTTLNTSTAGKSGVYCGATTGTPQWNDVVVTELAALALDVPEASSTCPRCAKCACDLDDLPSQWRVIVTGITNGGGCTDCANIDGTYIVNRTTSGSGICSGTLTLTGDCNITLVTVLIVVDAGGADGWKLQVRFFNSSQVQSVFYETAYRQGNCSGVVYTVGNKLDNVGDCNWPADVTCEGIV